MSPRVEPPLIRTEAGITEQVLTGAVEDIRRRVWSLQRETAPTTSPPLPSGGSRAGPIGRMVDRRSVMVNCLCGGRFRVDRDAPAHGVQCHRRSNKHRLFRAVNYDR